MGEEEGGGRWRRFLEGGRGGWGKRARRGGDLPPPLRAAVPWRVPSQVPSRRVGRTRVWWVRCTPQAVHRGHSREAPPENQSGGGRGRLKGGGAGRGEAGGGWCLVERRGGRSRAGRPHMEGARTAAAAGATVHPLPSPPSLHRQTNARRLPPPPPTARRRLHGRATPASWAKRQPVATAASPPPTCQSPPKRQCLHPPLPRRRYCSRRRHCRTETGRQRLRAVTASRLQPSPPRRCGWGEAGSDRAHTPPPQR